MLLEKIARWPGWNLPKKLFFERCYGPIQTVRLCSPAHQAGIFINGYILNNRDIYDVYSD